MHIFSHCQEFWQRLQTDSTIWQTKNVHKQQTHGQTINALAVSSTATLEKIEPYGSLLARKQKNGAVVFFWRYSQGTKSERIAIGVYDSTAPPKSIIRTSKGCSVVAAIREAQVQAQRHFENRDNGGYSQLIETEGVQKSRASPWLLIAKSKPCKNSCSPTVTI